MIIGLSGKKQAGKDTVCKIIQYLIYNRIYERTPVDIAIALNNPDAIAPDYITHWERKLFAGKLKQIVCLLIGCTMEQLEDNEFKEKLLGEEWIKWAVTRLNVIIPPTTEYYSTEEETEKFEDNMFFVIKKVELTPRLLLQLLGTECGRNIIHPNIWINALFADYISIVDINTDPYEEHKSRIFPNWIITDVRFKNEAKAIKDRGGIILRIERPRDTVKCNNCNFSGEEDDLVWLRDEEDERDSFKGCPNCKTDGYLMDIEYDTHESETVLDDYDGFVATINNHSTIENLIENVKSVLKEFKIV